MKNVRRLLIMSALIPVVWGCTRTPTDGGCPSDGDTFQKMNDATYAVVLEFRVGSGANGLAYFTLGTAFAIDGRLLATNAHITEFFNELCGVEITNVFGVQSGTGTAVHLLRALTHPDYDGDPFASPDVGLLTSQEALPVILDVAAVGELGDLALGDDLLLAGFPGDVQELFEITPGVTVPQASSLSGRITALRAHSPTEVVTAENTDVIQHQIPTTPGTSGSPLVRCGEVAAINNAGTVQVIVTVDAAGNLAQDRTAAANNNFGVHAKYITEMMTLFSAQTLQGFELPPVDVPPCDGGGGGGEAGECGAGDDPACDFCWAGTEAENNCPAEWNGDGECDCGCQFQDQDCGGGGNPGECGAGDDPACDFCWAGTEAENNCLDEWNGDGGCDCGCQFQDSDCGGNGGGEIGLDWFTSSCSELGGFETALGACFIECETSSGCPAGSGGCCTSCEIPHCRASEPCTLDSDCAPSGWFCWYDGACSMECTEGTNNAQSSECPPGHTCYVDGPLAYCSALVGDCACGICCPPFCAGDCVGSPCCS